MIPRVRVVSSSSSSSSSRQLSVHLCSRDFASHPPTISPISLSSRRATRRGEAGSFRRTRNGTVADATSYLEVSPGRSHSSRAAAKKPNDRAEIDWHVRGSVLRSRSLTIGLSAVPESKPRISSASALHRPVREFNYSAGKSSGYHSRIRQDRACCKMASEIRTSDLRKGM